MHPWSSSLAALAVADVCCSADLYIRWQDCRNMKGKGCGEAVAKGSSKEAVPKGSGKGPAGKVVASGSVVAKDSYKGPAGEVVASGSVVAKGSYKGAAGEGFAKGSGIKGGTKAAVTGGGEAATYSSSKGGTKAALKGGGRTSVGGTCPWKPTRAFSRAATTLPQLLLVVGKLSQRALAKGARKLGKGHAKLLTRPGIWTACTHKVCVGSIPHFVAGRNARSIRSWPFYC